jgi:hypothetical protein
MPLSMHGKLKNTKRKLVEKLKYAHAFNISK